MLLKVTNSKEIHHGFHYKDGLNVLPKEEMFDDDPYHTCCPGGLYYTTEEYITKFLHFGSNLRIIGLPTDDPEFKQVRDLEGNKWRANKIILKEKYSLFEPETYKLFGSKITDNEFIVDLACEEGNIDFLNFWKESGLDLYYSTHTMDSASKNGHTHVLDWWLNSGLELKYSSSAMDLASSSNQQKSLQWWKESGLPLKYDHYAIDNASAKGHNLILRWWRDSGLDLDYTTDAILLAEQNEHIDTVKWWINSGLQVKYNILQMNWRLMNLLKDAKLI
jgi:hypothetical protein